MRLSTQLLRSLFAIPLLAIGLAAGVGPDVSSCRSGDADWSAMANTTAAELPAQGCAEALRPVGARALARMPGDIGQLGLRVRCAS